MTFASCSTVPPSSSTAAISAIMSVARAAIIWQPSTLPSALSAIRRIRPTGSLITMLRPLAATLKLPTVTSWPAAFAASSVMPTQAISGRV